MTVTGTEQRVYGTLVGGCIIDLHRFALVSGSTTLSPPNASTVTYADTTPYKQCGYKYAGYLTLFLSISGSSVYAAVEVRICKNDPKRIVLETYGEVAKTVTGGMALWFNKGTDKHFPTRDDFPETGLSNINYIDDATGKYYIWNETVYEEGSCWVKLNSTASGVIMPYATTSYTFKESKRNGATTIDCCKKCPSCGCKTCNVLDRFYITVNTGYYIHILYGSDTSAFPYCLESGAGTIARSVITKPYSEHFSTDGTTLSFSVRLTSNPIIYTGDCSIANIHFRFDCGTIEIYSELPRQALGRYTYLTAEGGVVVSKWIAITTDVYYIDDDGVHQRLIHYHDDEHYGSPGSTEPEFIAPAPTIKSFPFDYLKNCMGTFAMTSDGTTTLISSTTLETVNDQCDITGKTIKLYQSSVLKYTTTISEFVNSTTITVSNTIVTGSYTASISSL